MTELSLICRLAIHLDVPVALPLFSLSPAGRVTEALRPHRLIKQLACDADGRFRTCAYDVFVRNSCRRSFAVDAQANTIDAPCGSWV